MTALLFSSASLRPGCLLAPPGSLSRPRGTIRAELEEGRAAWRHRCTRLEQHRRPPATDSSAAVPGLVVLLQTVPSPACRRLLLVGAGVGTAVGLGLAAVGGAAVAAAAMAGGDPQRQAQRLVRQGMDKFRKVCSGDIESGVVACSLCSLCRAGAAPTPASPTTPHCHAAQSAVLGPHSACAQLLRPSSAGRRTTWRGRWQTLTPRWPPFLPSGPSCGSAGSASITWGSSRRGPSSSGK